MFGPVARELVDIPAGRTLYAIHVRRGNQGREDAAHPVDEIPPDFAVVVDFDQAF